MKIHLNGNPHPLEAEISLTELLDRLGFGGKPVLVELDEKAIFPRDYAQVRIRDGAKVELVTLAAGG
jgi:thiamine biosynthesis protein ThiS